MRGISVVLLALGLALMGLTAATAQTTCVPAAPTQAPETTMTQPQTSVGVISVPAGFGAGPVNDLALMTRGPQFDQSYARIQYQQHSEVAALANLGAQRASDPSIRSLSQKMVNERVDMNQKIGQWYSGVVPAGLLTVDELRVADIRGELEGLSDVEFDRAYVDTMLVLLEQEMRIANEGTFKATDRDLYRLANLEHRTAYNEIKAFQNWREQSILDRDL